MKLLTVTEVAEQLRVSQYIVRSLCDQGKLQSIRPSGPRGARRILLSSMESYVESLLGDRPPALKIAEPVFDDSEARLAARIKRMKKVV